MPSDVRALLKAKRQEARIVHPLAVYSTSGQLKCTACTINVKHASAWEGHMGSKAHRINATRLKEEERQKEAWKENPKVQGKRCAEDDYPSDDEETNYKRRKVPVQPGVDENGAIEHNPFPADFFTDPSQAPPPSISDDSQDEEEMKYSPAVALANAVIDFEWERFQRDVVNTPHHRETYERATVFAEPVIASQVQEGFPSQQSDATEEAHVNRDSEEARRRKEQDDRELIMDRLLDEERAQEEADMKVTVMKERLDALKEKREAAKAAAKQS